MARSDNTHKDKYVDDDELLKRAVDRIDEWRTATNSASLTQVQALFHELVCAGGSAMLRDKVVELIISAFDCELGGRAALKGTWSLIAKHDATKGVREKGADGGETVAGFRLKYGNLSVLPLFETA